MVPDTEEAVDGVDLGLDSIVDTGITGFSIKVEGITCLCTEM